MPLTKEGKKQLLALNTDESKAILLESMIVSLLPDGQEKINRDKAMIERARQALGIKVFGVNDALILAELAHSGENIPAATFLAFLSAGRESKKAFTARLAELSKK